MPTVLSDRCPKCGRVIPYTAQATELLCPCGHRFLVTEFISERLRMEQAQADRAKAREDLAAAKTEKAELQARLNGTLTALESIESAQQAEDAKLGGILDALKADRQTHDAMAALLRALRQDQQDGRDALSRVLCAMMKEQTDAAGKLSAVRELAAQILSAQSSGTQAVEQMQDEVLERIDKLDLKVKERFSLSSDFFAWSRSMREADAARLQSLQASSDALLRGHKAMSEKLDVLSAGIARTQDAVDRGFDELRRQRLDKLIELYHQATGLQIERKFDKAEDTYRELLAEGSSDVQDAEIYWRMLLCHYGVEYQEENGKTIPIILHPDLSDPETMQARKDLREHIKGDQQRAHYAERLKTIDAYLERYRQVRLNPKWAFDVFISVKQNDHGRHTQDSDAASELYNYFIQDPGLAGKKLRVFNSRHTHLPVGEAYEPYIIAALMSAKVLIVVGSTPEYMNSQWVRNEWSRFQYLQESERRQGKTDRRLFCYLTGGMRPKDLPVALNPDNQVLTEGPAAGSILRELMDQVFPDRVVHVDEPRRPAAPLETPGTIANRMNMWLKLEQYQKVIDQYNRLLDTRAEILMDEPRLCLYTLCARSGCRTLEALVSARADLRGDALYESAYESADDTLRARLDALWAKKAEKPARKPIVKPAQKPVEDDRPKERTYPDGTYVGQIVNGMRQGHGVMTYADGGRYDGEWKNDLFHGRGVFAYPDVKGLPSGSANGGQYDGEWKDGKRHGKGVLLFSAQDMRARYEGEWIDDKCCGHGVLTWFNGDEYDGELKDDKRCGHGVMAYGSGDKYDGQWENDLRSGAGVMSFRDQEPYGRVQYDGEWKNDQFNGRGVMTWKNGDKYDGEWKNDRRDGAGVMLYGEGDKHERRKYDGEWKDNLKNGRGVMEFVNGDRYDGEWKNDKCNGWGVYEDNSFEHARYEGEWIDDEPCGKGVMRFLNGSMCDGEWKNGKFNGRGVMVYDEGDPFNRARYEGELNDAELCGQGVMYFRNGDRYDGKWENDKPDGKGVMTYADGGKYDGLWKDGKANGHGVMSYANGDKYDGEWVNDECYGTGTMTYANGDVYSGKWKNNLFNGQGVFRFSSANEYGCFEYTGEWKDGTVNGAGVMTWKNGNRYVGEWKDGKPDGKGVMTYADGGKYDGLWKDGKANGRGVFHYSSNVYSRDKYDGEWKDDKPDGKGVMYYSNGSKYDGEWKDGKANGRGVLSRKNVVQYDGQWKDDKYNGRGTCYYDDGNRYEGEFVNGVETNGTLVKKNGKRIEYKNGWRKWF